MEGHTHHVTSVAFTPDGQKIVTASEDMTVRVWIAATGDCEYVIKSHTSSVNSAAFIPDGLKIVSASEDKTVRVWSVATGDCEQTMTGHTSLVTSAAFSPDGLKIVSASGRLDDAIRQWCPRKYGDRTVRVWIPHYGMRTDPEIGANDASGEMLQSAIQNRCQNKF
jgi:WD40 repeat protein